MKYSLIILFIHFHILLTSLNIWGKGKGRITTSLLFYTLGFNKVKRKEKNIDNAMIIVISTQTAVESVGPQKMRNKTNINIIQGLNYLA